MQRGVNLPLRHKILILAVLLALGFLFAWSEFGFLGFQARHKAAPSELIEGDPLPRNVEKIPTH